MTVQSGLAHGGILLLLLLAPTVLGAVIDRLLATSPLGLAVGAGIGIVAASVITTRRFRGRIEMLAPTDAEEDSS